MKDLLVDCPHLQLVNDKVYLTESGVAAHVMPTITTATSHLLSSSSSESGDINVGGVIPHYTIFVIYN